MKRARKLHLSGRQLVADFQTVLLAKATAQVARYEAERSETNLLRQLSSATRGLYLNGPALTELPKDYIAHASVDAHIKKVQAEQLTALSNIQIDDVVMQARDDYIGQKVRVTRVDEDFNPFDAAWFDSRAGYRSNVFKRKSVEGKIEDIIFDQNLIVIKPGHILRLINSSLQYYMVYVINPDTLKPSVSISLKNE